MKPLPLALASAATGALVSAAAVLVLAPRDARAGGDPELAVEVERLAGAVSDLRARAQATERELEALARAPVAPAAPAPVRVPLGEIEAAVASWMAEHGPAAASLEAPAEELVQELALLDVRALADLLFDDDVPFVEREELWQELRKEGRLEDVIAELEARAERDPSNPDVQVELGYAYIQKIQEVGAGPLAGVWATKADQAFDAALEMDPGHWEARFTRAVALSHWPAFLGKKSQAIHELETLVEVQSAKAPQPEHANTYLVLGNLYLESGNQPKAVATWKKGLALFPDADEIAAQLALAQ